MCWNERQVRLGPFEQPLTEHPPTAYGYLTLVLVVIDVQSLFARVQEAETGFEALRYYALIEKRVALGLATPALANRFLLWGWMGITMGAGAGANLYFLATHIDVVADPRAQSVTSAVGLAQAVLLYLTFLPPRRYARWIETRWGAPRADSAGSRA